MEAKDFGVFLLFIINKSNCTQNYYRGQSNPDKTLFMKICLVASGTSKWKSKVIKLYN